MAEKDPQPQGTADASKPSGRRQGLLLAFIQHGSRPAALAFIGLLVVAWLFTVRQPALALLGQAQKLKVGSFEVELRAKATEANVEKELQALNRLSEDQLQLFLVIAKSRSHITYQGAEVTEANLEKLREAGLLAEWKKGEGGGYWWAVSEDGHRLHEVVRRVILSSIRKSAG